MNEMRDWWEELLQVHEFAHYRDYAETLTAQEIDFIQQALGLAGVETILDLDCGGGRHTIELARRGLTMVGLDASRPVIAAAKLRASELELSAQFLVGDMRDLSHESRFDAVLIMNSSLGFFDDQTNADVLARAAQALVPGGRLLLQLINPYQIERYLRDFRNGWYALGAGVVLREAQFLPLEGILQINYRYVEAERQLDVTHPGDRIRLYTFPEVRAMLTAAGLRPLSIFGDAVLPVVPFDEQSQWQVIVAERPRPLSVAEPEEE